MTKKQKKADGAPVIRREGRFLETFAQLQDKISARAHEIFSSREPSAGDHLSDWLAAESDVLTAVALNVAEEDDRYVVRGELPGFAPSEIQIHIEAETLMIGGSHSEESKREGADGVQRASSEVSFFRRMTLPRDADLEHIDAKVTNGRLEVVVPKR